MDLASLTTTAAADVLDSVDVALLPTGSTEQHGPALPLSTDSDAAEAVAAGVDRADTIRLPPVTVGVSEHHRQFHGTLWLAPETFEAVVRETLESIASHGVRKAVIVNGHGGNVDALRRVARTLRGEATVYAVPWSWWAGVPVDLKETLFDEEGGHADAGESSVMLALRESLVDRDALAAAEADGSAGWGRDVAGADVGFDTIDFSPSGATGRPTQADADAGRELLDAAGRSLDELIDWLVDQPLESLWPKPHV